MISPDVAMKIVCRYSAAFVADVAAEGGRTSEALALLEDLVARIFVVSVKPAGLEVAFTQFATDAAEILGAVTAAAAARARKSRRRNLATDIAAGDDRREILLPIADAEHALAASDPPRPNPKRHGIDIEESTS